jgi:hypothetical protein
VGELSLSVSFSARIFLTKFRASSRSDGASASWKRIVRLRWAKPTCETRPSERTSTSFQVLARTRTSAIV